MEGLHQLSRVERKLRDYTAKDMMYCLDIIKSNIPFYFSKQEFYEFSSFLKELIIAARGSIDPGRGDFNVADHNLFRINLSEKHYKHYSVLEDDMGIIVGCGGITIERGSQEGRLTWGMIHRTRHREGLGLCLTLARLSQLANLPQITKITLNTSQKTLGFYTKLGFKEVNCTPNGYGEGLDRHDMEVTVDERFRKRLQELMQHHRISANFSTCIDQSDLRIEHTFDSKQLHLML